MSRKILRKFAISSWKILAKSKYLYFKNNLQHIEKIQKKILEKLLNYSDHTIFAKDYGLSPRMTYKEFVNNLPIQNYDSLKPYIERIMNGEQTVLSKSRIRKINLTSGSSDSAKLIPFTDASAEEFAHSIGVWMYGLIEYRKLNTGGNFYFSITPSGMDSYKKNGVNVGFDNDSDYFGILERYMSRLIMATPDSLSKMKDLDQVILYTVCYLLQSHNLILISIWNPSFLQRLLDFIFYNRELIYNQMYILFGKKINKRIQNIKQILISASNPREVNWLSIWPQLKIISTWSENHAFPFFQNLKTYIPNIEFETKGVVATEGFISVPFYNSNNPPLNLLSYTSHYYEFRNRKSEILLAQDLSVGDEVEVIMSLGNGFLRYAIGDWFRIKDKVGSVPALEFIGREEIISDLCGEKLNQNFLILNLVPELKKFGIKENDFYIQGNIELTKAFYTMYIQSLDSLSSELIQELSNLVERILLLNPHYKYARALNQLDKIRLQIMDSLSHGKIGRIATTKNSILRPPISNIDLHR